jgi:hypothetical protein
MTQREGCSIGKGVAVNLSVVSGLVVVCPSSESKNLPDLLAGITVW